MAVAMGPTTSGSSGSSGNIRRRWAAVALALVALAAVLLTLEVRLAASETQSGAQVGSGRSGAANDVQIAGARLVLYVEGDDALTDTLRQHLVGRLDATGLFAGVDVRPGPPGAADHPVLVASLTEREVFWTPLYATGKVEVTFAFASHRGNLSWRDTGPFVFEGGAQVYSRGQVQVTDTTRGLVSRPAYLTHLGQQMAGQVAEQIRLALSRPPSAGR